MPIVLANATVPLLGAVDTGVVGQLGQAAPIGAVGIGAVILSAIYWVFGFLRMGTTGLTSQALGAGDGRERRALLNRALLLAALAGLGIILLQGPLMRAAFWLSPASGKVEGLAGEYIGIRVFSAPAAIALYGITGWLIALERTRAVLVLQVLMNGMNVVLDLWFVLGLGWGISGVAVATFLAEWSGLGLGLWFCREALLGGAWRDTTRIFDAARWRRMLAVNGDIAVRSILLQGAFMAFLFLGARLGDITLAANQILLQFLEITAFALDGFAFAAETLVGQAVGGRRRAEMRRAAVLSSLWGCVVVAVMALFFATAGRWLVAVMTTSEGVRAMATIYLPWVVAAPLIGIASWMLDGIFIGATRTRDMRNAMLVSVLIYVAAVAVLFVPYGNHGLWAALMVLFVARAATLALRYSALEAAAFRP